MARQIKQFLYNGNADTKEDFITGTKFNEFSIVQLGIQGLPGMKFRLNGSVNYIVIGSSGIYDLDIKNGAKITTLQFEEASLDRIDENHILIIDIIYETDEGVD